VKSTWGRMSGWVLGACVALAWTARGAEQVFVFGADGAKHNNIMIESQTDLESIITTSNTISGEMKYDVEAKTGSAKLSVPVKSLSTGIAMRDEHLQGDKWLNMAKNPNIAFETTAVKHKDGEQYEVTGNFTMNGVTKPVTAVATLKYIPYKPEFEKAHLPKANIVKVSTTFELKLSDFEVKTPAVPAMVSDALKVTLRLTGFAKLKE